MHERRQDPRTSKPFSLRNLLKTRAERQGLLIAVVGTQDGFVMASSRDAGDKQGPRVVAHASSELFGREGEPFFMRLSRGPEHVGFLATRVEVGGASALVAALVPSDRLFSLEELAVSVKRILLEPAPGQVAAA
jgi:hypothetical protein